MTVFKSGKKTSAPPLRCRYFFSAWLISTLLYAPSSVASDSTSLQQYSDFPSTLSKPVLAKQISVTGGSKALHENIRLHIELNNPNLNGINAKRRITELATRAANALGFYQLDLSIEVYTAEQRLIITINSSQAILWTDPVISVEPPLDQLPELQTQLKTLIENSGVKANTQLNHKAYDELKAKMITECKNNAYLDADYIDSTLKINVDKKIATAIYNLDCGKPYRIASESFSGSQLNEQTLSIITHNYNGKEEPSPRKANKSHSEQLSDNTTADNGSTKLIDNPAINQPFHNQTVRQYYRNLSASGYFTSIDISREKVDAANIDESNQAAEEDKWVDIKIQLKDKPKHQFLTGIGFGTDTGPRAQFSWEQAVLNSKGHSLTSKIELSPTLQSINNRYRVPTPHPLFDFNEYKLAYFHEDIENKTTDKTTLSHSWNYKYPSQWFQVLQLNLEHEISQVDGEARETDTLLLPEASWSISDVSPWAWLGHYQLWTRVASGQKFLGSSTAFLKAQVGTKLQIPLGQKNQVITRFEIGGIKTPDLSEVPLSQRFFTGGDQTVRGYDFEELGLAQSDSEIEGGKYLNVASLEHNYLFKPHWRTAVFVDAGRAYSDVNQRIAYSAGLGIRWLSPVGQLRVDVARPIDDPQATSFRLHFFLGGEL